MTDTLSVFIGQPSYDGRIEQETAASWLMLPSQNRKCKVGQYASTSSLLAYGFNKLWCQALNLAKEGKVNRFAMIHGDVICERGGWLDRLEAILQEHDADVVSVVVPIKTTEGITSTAIGDVAQPWKVIKRLTMTEIMELPETFTAADCGYPDNPLLVNTGLWLCRLDRGDWQRRTWFEIMDRIVQDKDGNLQPQCVPEDWHWSRQVWDLGAKVVATRAIKVEHVGRMRFTNSSPWGSCKVDPNFVNDHPSKET